jgi:hypothetical protein
VHGSHTNNLSQVLRRHWLLVIARASCGRVGFTLQNDSVVSCFTCPFSIARVLMQLLAYCSLCIFSGRSSLAGCRIVCAYSLWRIREHRPLCAALGILPIPVCTYVTTRKCSAVHVLFSARVKLACYGWVRVVFVHILTVLWAHVLAINVEDLCFIR